MYRIINKTKKITTITSGRSMKNYWPIIKEELNAGDKIVVMHNEGSNTIKVPYMVVHNGIVEWEWENYSY
jgi:hypothetical protein